MDRYQYDIQPVWQEQQQQQQPQHQYQDYHDQAYLDHAYQSPDYQGPDYQGPDYHGQAYFGHMQTAKPQAQAEIIEDARRASVLNAKGRPKPDYRPMALRWWYILVLFVTCLALAGLVLYAEHALRNTDNTAVIQGRGIESRYNKMIHDEAWDRYREGMRLWGRQDASQVPPQVDAQPTADSPPAPETPAAGGPQNSPEPPVQTQAPPPNTVPAEPTQPAPPPQNAPSGPPAQNTPIEPTQQEPPPKPTQADPPPKQTQADPPPKPTQADPSPKPTQADPPPAEPTQADPPPNSPPANGDGKQTAGKESPAPKPPPNTKHAPPVVSQPVKSEPKEPQPTEKIDNSNTNKQPPSAPPATSRPPDKTLQEPPAATTNQGDKSPAPGTTKGAPTVDAEQTTPGQSPSGQDDADKHPTPKPSPGPESPAPTTTDSGDDGEPRGIVTSAWVEVETTSWLTRPGEPTVITTYTEITVTRDEIATVTSTIFTSINEQPSPNNMAQVMYDKAEAIPSPPEITTTFITTFILMKATEDDGDGNAIYQPAATTTFTTTYRAGDVKTVPILITTIGPPITYAVTGKTTIFSTFTIDPVQGKQIAGPTTRTLTSDVPGFLSTIVETPAPVIRTTYGADGLPTAVTETFPPVTRVISIPATRVVLTDISTPTALQDLVVVSATTYTLTSTGYYVGKFVPVLVAVVLVLAIRAIDMTAQQYQPFASLARPHGAAGRDSLTLDFEGWGGIWRPFRLARQGQWVPLLANTAYYLSIAIPSVTSEAIGIKIHGRCSMSAIHGCALNLGVSRLWSFILAGLLVAVALVLLAVLIVVSRHWRTGVFADPWCVVGAAALARNPELAQSVGSPDFQAVKADLAEKYYALGWFRNAEGREEYGLVLQETRRHRRDDSGVVMMPQAMYPDASRVRPNPQNGLSAKIRRPPRTFTVLTAWWRLIFLIYLMALLGVVLFYYSRRKLVPEKVRWFMEGGNRYGARLITSGLGVAAMIGWDCIFDSIAVVAPYRLMADEPQPGSRSALAGRPTYAVTGIWAGIRNRDWLLGLAAFMTVISHFLPMLFANVPYNLTQMEAVHTICSRLSAGLLALMVVVLGAAFCLDWPEMPVDPRSIAGQMWYVAQSSAVDLMDGVSSLNGRERKRRLEMLGARWTFGRVRTPFGDRVGVELVDFRSAAG